MINTHDILETINMIQEENLDIRTITMGISLLDCADSDIDKLVIRFMTRFAKEPKTSLRRAKISKESTVFRLSTRGFPLLLLQW